MSAGEIHFVDTTIRDGHQSLWASNMTTGMILPIAENLDKAGFPRKQLEAYILTGLPGQKMAEIEKSA